MGVSKATYYNCVSPNDRLTKKYEHVKKYVVKIIEKRPTYGIRRIKAELEQNFDIFIGRDTLAKLLVLWGLSLPRKVKRKKKSMIEKILLKLRSKANLLAQTNITEPFQAITTDITRLEYKNGHCYFCVYKDVLGQMVYGWSVSNSMDTTFVLKAYAQAVRNIKRMVGYLPKNLIVHQDQGTQYTSYVYLEEILQNFRISFSKKGTPTDNPGQESFFGRFKEELRYDILEQNSVHEVQRLSKRKIKDYNEKRIHTSIGYKTPKNYTVSILKNKKKRFGFFRT